MSITSFDYALPCKTHNKYDIFFNSFTIHTMITNTPSMVDEWFLSINPYLNNNNNNVIVGLDVECLLAKRHGISNTAAVLQLCIGGECLIFQILHASYIPESLIAFLGNKNYKFVGVGIKDDVDKLLRDFSLHVVSFVDLRTLAAIKRRDESLKFAGLKTLAFRVLGIEIEKSKKITLSDWSNFPLTVKQIEYACLDAFISFELGRILFL
ncbi:uncharacterized protein LOC127131103 [Lathyrus oleraceus]|uniref:uncharacterized protein LOC127131103 n=1 Tax=Pisum sativum TaxID=3888 RepID=UPI001FC678C0|nr:uncharacterized protein LOC127131103 [Pisum sativum]